MKMQTALIMCTLLYSRRLPDYKCNNQCFITSKAVTYPDLYNIKHIYHRETLHSKINCNGIPSVNITYSMEPDKFHFDKERVPFSFHNASLNINYGELIKATAPQTLRLVKKKYNVCWIVSNLNQKKKYVRERLEFYRNLTQHIPVTTFGLISGYKISTKMYNKIVANCTFYLAFENANEPHYITEKLWAPMRLDSIPVTFPKTRHEYEAVIPSDSFIHYTDFSVRDLAEYMKSLHENIFLQLKHKKWKVDFAVKQHVMGPDHLCNLC